MDFLEPCARRHDQLVEEARRAAARGDALETVRAVERAAHHAWFHHPGRFCDPDLEALLLDVGETLTGHDDTGLSVARGSRSRVLHVTTRTFEVGGHTRAIANWVREDPARNHTLAITDQEGPVRAELAAAVAESGGSLIMCPAGRDQLRRARWLRSLARTGFEAIILHHFPSDAVPIVAFAPAGGPPVAVLNHADHVFWLGVTVADEILCIRPAARRLARERRFGGACPILPSPMRPARPSMTKEEARRALGLPPDAPVLLTIGSGYKYAPTPTHDFFRATGRVLDAHPGAQLHMIGLQPAEFATMGVPSLHPRCRLHGIVSKPEPWQVAADLALDPFPFGSTTALLESALLGAFPVLGPKPEHLILTTDDPALDRHLIYPEDETAYVTFASDRLEPSASRAETQRALCKDVLDHHSGDTWRAGLERIHAALRTRVPEHRPRRLPPAPSLRTEHDLAVSRFHRALPGWVSRE